MDLKYKEDAVMESIEGYKMTDVQTYRLVRAHMDCTKSLARRLAPVIIILATL